MENPPKLPEHSEPTGNLKRIDYPANPRLVRMRALSRLLDTAITLPGGFRIGIDPIIGLVPGIGDLIASSLSVWLIYDAARMGISKVTLARMIGNVMMEAAIGAVPLLGDIIDAVWKANAVVGLVLYFMSYAISGMIMEMSATQREWPPLIIHVIFGIVCAETYKGMVRRRRDVPLL